MKARTVVTALWGLAAMAAALWPARVLSPLDGAPLNRHGEALLIGLALPALWWFAPQATATRIMRGLIAALLIVKTAALAITPEGLCARFSTAQPLDGIIQTIPIVEPAGVVRSWDVRADWRAEVPRCTAIVDRAYTRTTQFPAWFVNIVDFITPGRRELTLELTGYVQTSTPGTLEWHVGEDMTLEAPATMTLDAGVHPLTLRASVRGERWALTPMWDGEDAWKRVSFMQAPPAAVQAAGSLLRWVIAGLTLALLLTWAGIALAPYRRERWLLTWTAVASLVMAALAANETTARLAPLLLVASVLVPIMAARQLRSAFLLVGVPWLVYFAVRAWPQIGEFSTYSADDWLTYQVAGYRIFMHGYWLEGGTPAFDYQPLYRWLTGALHVVFGDSSVGELFWDAASLLVGALLAFHLVRRRAGFRWGLAAAGLTLTTFTVGTPWYFLGRGLSEVAAAGFAFLAIFFLLRAKAGAWRWSVAAGIMAVLMFYTRLNHLLLAAFIPAALLPLTVPARWSSLSALWHRLHRRCVVTFVSVFVAGVFAFMTRTWWYTGVFSLFYGTSLRHNDTGLRPWTMFDSEVWSRVGHSLAGLAFMNEPPSPDPRAGFVTLGMLLAFAALLPLPIVRQQPLAIVLLVLGACVGAFFAHAHHYPGRLSIHLVPLAVALSLTTIAAVVHER